MLIRRASLALGVAASLGAASAYAEQRNVEAESLVSEFVAKGDANAPAKASPQAAAPADAPYPHIYQAPLFGTLFAVSSPQASVDESALRYYASLHNFARANAEIKRLKALHPNWTPPTNIYSTAGAGADEQPFWDLLAADRLEELRAGMALKERSTPGWQPSRDLTNKIARKTAIEELVKKTDAHKPAEALAVADSDPSILHCAYMDANWRVADAFLDVGLPKRAFEIYHAIIATCPDHDERLATVRKSISRFTFDQTRSLIEMGAKSADGATEFDAAKIDLTRARIAAVNQGKSTETIEPEALNDFFADATRTRARADLALAGWFEYNGGRFDAAEKWFSLATLGSPKHADAVSVNLAEGRALSLLKLDRVEDALTLAYAWRDVSKTMRETYVGATASLFTRVSPPPQVSDQTLADFAAFVQGERHFVGATAIGWLHYNRSEWDDAALWFKTALAWKGVDPTAAPGKGPIEPDIASAVEGYGRALARSGRLDEATQVADLWRGEGPALEAVFVSLMGAAVDAAPLVTALGAEPLQHFEQIAGDHETVAAAASLGWLDYRSADYTGAIAWFRKSIAWAAQGRGDVGVNQGLALSLKQIGQLAEAEDISWAFVKDSADMRAIYVSAVVAELAGGKAALTPSRISRFIGVVAADRSAAGAQALGWFRLKEGNCAYAAPWFRKAADWSAASGEDAETARGLALSLKAVGAFASAEDLAYAWRERDAGMRALYLDIGVEELASEAPVAPMSEARIGRLSEMVMNERHVAGARALGWRRYREGGNGYGGHWLQLAIDWSDSEKRDVKTDEALGLTYRATGRLAQAASLALPWIDSTPLMKKLYVDVMVERLARDNPPEPIDEAQLKEFADVITVMRSPLGAQALGWYRLERGENDEAARMFKLALDGWPSQRLDLTRRLAAPVADYTPILAKLALTPDDYRRTPLAYASTSALTAKPAEDYINTAEGLAKTQEGYVQSLRALGRLDEAEAIAWSWRDRWPAMRKLFVDIATDALAGKAEIAPERMRRYVAAIEDARSASAGTAMAWRFLRAKSNDAAIEWFAKALAWSPTNPPDSGLVEGYVAALQANKKFAEADALAARWRGAGPRFDLVYLQSQLLGLQATGKADQETIDKYASIEGEIEKMQSGPGALSLGWLTYQAKDYSRALKWFREAVEWGGDGVGPKAKEGLALSLRALGQFEELAVFGHAERRSSPAVRDVYYGGMIAWLAADKPEAAIKPEARAFFEEAVLADRSALGAQALGWSDVQRQQWPGARRWFENAAAWSGFDPLVTPEKPDADRGKLVEGYVQALRGSGDAGKAEDVAYAWREAGPALADLYFQIVTQGVAEDAAALTPQRLTRFAAFAEAKRSPDAAGALGWRFYRAKDAPQAVVWFEKALAFAPDGAPPPKIAEGYVLSLRAAGRLPDAETFAWSYAKDSPDMRALYVSVVVAELADAHGAVTPARLDRFAATVVETRSAAGARALGWRRLAQDNCVYAVPWFRKAAAWNADAADDAQTARGLALALQKAGAFPEAEQLAYAWRDRVPDMGKLFLDIGVEELASEAPVVKLSEARLERFSERVLSEHNVSGAQALGWRRYREAGNGYGGNWFRLAAAWAGDDKRDVKTDEGYALTLRAVGRLADAEALALRWAADAPQMKTLYIEVTAEELARDNPPEPIDDDRLKDFVAALTPLRSALGAQALGWYRLERGEQDDAARWFKQALDWWPQQTFDRSRGLAADGDDYKPILAKLALDPRDYRRTPRAYPNSSALIGKASQNYVATEEGLAKTQEGYVQALRALGRSDEAEAIAYAWRDRWPSLRGLYLDIAAAELDRRDGPALAPERLRRFLDAIEADHAIAGAAAMAWREYRHNAPESASDWFRKSIAWSKGSPSPGVIEGYVLALEASKKFEMAAAVAKKWRDSSPELNLIYVQSELERLRAAGKSDQVTAAQFAEIEKTLTGAQNAQGALSLAWVAYEAHDYAHALLWFRKVTEWGGDAADPKAKEGIALSLRGLGRFEELAEFGFAERKTSDAIHDAYFGGMVAWLTSDKPLREVNQEARLRFEDAVAEERSTVGAQALAWGSLIRGDWGRSRKWFETALDWSGVDALAPQGTADAERSKLIEGYVQALRSGGDLGRGEDIAYIWRDASPILAGLYLEIFTQELSVDSVVISDERLRRFAATTEARQSAAAAGALGWRAYRAKSFGESIAWFEKALRWSPGQKADAKIEEGNALSLRAAGRLVEAEDFAWDHRADARELRAAYVAAFSDQLLDPELSLRLSSQRLGRFSEIVVADKLSSGAAALGWRRLKDGNCGYSLNWFRSAIAWSERGAGDDKIYSGYAQGLRAVGMFNEAEDAAFAFADRSPEARELYTNIVIEELTRQWPRVPMSEPRIARFSGIVMTDRSPKGAQALGWRRYMQAGWGYGQRWFALAAAWSPDRRGDAHLNEGYALTARAAGRLTLAEGIAYPWIDRVPAMKKLYIDVAVEELSHDNPPEPIPEARVSAFEAAFASARSALGAQALGWYRFSRGENDLAARAFRNALDWWPPHRDDADEHLTAPPDDYKPILARLALDPKDYRRTPLAYPNSSLLIGHDTESYVNTSLGLAKTVEGYVRSLAALSRFEEAETLGFQWADRWSPLRGVLIDLAAAELSSDGADAIAQDRLARFVKLVEDSRSAAGAEAFGWHVYKAKDYATAAKWFHTDIGWRGADGKLSFDVARAYIDSLRNLKQYDDALQFVAAWRARMPDLDAVGLDVSLDSLAALDPDSAAAEERVRAIAAGVAQAHSASGATQLGWLAFGRKEFVGAQAWFKKAIQWAPAGADPDPKALEGYARTLQAERRLDPFMRFTDEWSARVPSLKPLFLEASAQVFALAAANGQDLPTATLARAGKAFAEAKSSNGAQALAWQRLSQKDWITAAGWFQAARDWSKAPDEDLKTTEGFIIALRNLHRDDEAETLAYDAGQRDESMRALYLETVAERLTRTPPSPPNAEGMRRFAEAVVAAKSGNGAQALGWYSFNAHQYQPAVAWFEKSLGFEPSENAALGLAFAYRKLGDRENFQRIVDTYRETFAKVGDLVGKGSVRERRAAFEDAGPAPKRLRAIIVESARRPEEPASAGGKGGGGGQGAALGWKLLNAGRPSEAASVFENSMQSASGRERQQAAYGRSLSLLASGDPTEAGRAAADGDLDPKQRKDMGAQLMSRRGWDAYNAGRFLEALNWVNRRVAFAPEGRDLMQLRVLALRGLNRMEEAAKVQQKLDDQLVQ